MAAGGQNVQSPRLESRLLSKVMAASPGASKNDRRISHRALVSPETICYMPRAGSDRPFVTVRSWRNW
ncbi:protein of unknown function [Aminobacter niigataensis]|nr:protein of unknown function [Aminobacter niigataensis]